MSIPEGYQLVFEDNFDYEGPLNPADWNCEVGERWANNEQQAYTDHLANVKVKDGCLHLTSLKEEYGIPTESIPGNTAILKSGQSYLREEAPGRLSGCFRTL